MYCNADNILKFLPDFLAKAISSQTDYTTTLTDKIDKAEKYVIYFILLEDTMPVDVNDDIKYAMELYTALLLIQHYASLTPSYQGQDLEENPNIINLYTQWHSIVKSLRDKYLHNIKDGMPEKEDTFKYKHISDDLFGVK